VRHFTFSTSVAVMTEYRSKSQSGISVMGPVSFSGLQLRKMF